MRSCVIYIVATVAFVLGIPGLSSANLFEYFSLENESVDTEGREENGENLADCECLEASCTCCVDFNLTYIDLGGPGCVKMKYLSQDEGLMVNVSYGESTLHSQQVKGSKPSPTCLALLTNVAEMCARFPNLEPHDDGLKGCLLLEPKLLGAVTSHFKIGCFTMGPQGMALDKTNDTVHAAESLPVMAATTNVTQNQNESIIGGDLLAIVNETAEKGLSFISNLLGFSFNDDVSEGDLQGSSAPANPASESPNAAR